MLNIGDKVFMNLQEAVSWLLENNALPFQSTADYAPNTEIAMSTLVNPSPAKVRVGSLIFFADSKVSTVVGVTSNSFIVSDKYNNLVDDIVYVSGVAINASGHLITTLSNGNTIDAGLIKQVSSFSINASQHLIATFNNGTSQDLGAIFSGNINISGNLTVSGGISGNAITGDSIIENMSGYSFSAPYNSNYTVNFSYVGVVKNGNKITFVISGKINFSSLPANDIASLGAFGIPSAIGNKLFPYNLSGIDTLANTRLELATNYYSYKYVPILCVKNSAVSINPRIYSLSGASLSLNTDYYFRYEATFLLSDSLAS